MALLSWDDIEHFPKQYKFIIIAVIAAAVALCLFYFYLHREFINDDTYISLRYAYNYINGDGLVWNPGEYAEGYTNFLHIILISSLGIFGIDLLLAARIVNTLAFVVMNLLLLRYLFRRRTDPHDRREIFLLLFPLIMVLNISPMISWIYGGLEGPLFAMFCTGGILYMSDYLTDSRHNKSLITASLFFALATMTRPDGVIFMAAAIIFMAALLWRKKQLSLAPILALTLPFLLLYAPYFIWRYSYYGELLPLTYYAKATGLSFLKMKFGLQYLSKYLIAPPYLFAILILLIPFAVYKKSFDRRSGYILLTIALYLIYITLIGGDYMYSFRFLLPLIPASILLAFLLLKPYLKNIRMLFVLPACAVIFGLLIFQMFQPGTDVRKMAVIDKTGARVGRYIARTWPKGSLVALNTAGSTPYFAPEHRFIDMLGINDPHIAKRKIDSFRLNNQHVPGHSKGDGAYVLSREPDYIILGPAKGISIRVPWFLSDLEMQSDPRFNQHYRIHRDSMPDFIFTYYARIK